MRCAVPAFIRVEPAIGSTRMKAGTAQRITLGILSSLLMIRLGRVYEGLMVDVQTTNKKLVQRAETMLMQLTGCAPNAVHDALARADGSVKLAVLLLKGCKPKEAKQLLARCSGSLRLAMAQLEPD